MAETLISPGVLARENDQSQVTSQPVQAGACIVGPTVLGRVGVPKLVTTYSEYLVNYGSTFASGSDEYTYFTSISAFNYFNNGGTSLIVNRVASGSWLPANTTTDPIRNDENSGELELAPFDFTGSIANTGQGGSAVASNTGTGIYTTIASEIAGVATTATFNINRTTTLGRLKSGLSPLLKAGFVAGTNPVDCIPGNYPDVVLSQTNVPATATATVVVDAATSIPASITVNNPTGTGGDGSGYEGGTVTIAAGALGTGQFANTGGTLNDITTGIVTSLAGNGTVGLTASPITFTAGVGTADPATVGTGATFSVTTTKNGKLFDFAGATAANSFTYGGAGATGGYANNTSAAIPITNDPATGGVAVGGGSGGTITLTVSGGNITTCTVATGTSAAYAPGTVITFTETLLTDAAIGGLTLAGGGSVTLTLEAGVNSANIQTVATTVTPTLAGKDYLVGNTITFDSSLITGLTSGTVVLTVDSTMVEDSKAGSATIVDGVGVLVQATTELLIEPTLFQLAAQGSDVFSNVTPSVITILGSLIGGVDVTNDITFTVTGADLIDAETFTLETLSEGALMNSGTSPLPSTGQGSNGTLTNGLAQNVRWEIQATDPLTGTFSLIIRAGNDTATAKSILEIFPNVSLDPKASNYVAKVVGDMKKVLDKTNLADPFITTEGQYPNASRYVRVSNVAYKTPNYFNNDGTPKTASFATYLPDVASGSFALGTGRNSNRSGLTPANYPAGGDNYYDQIDGNNIQGLNAQAAVGTGDGGILSYSTAFNVLANKDDYQYNIITAPGLVMDFAMCVTPINLLIQNTANRGDAIAIVDLVGYQTGTITSAITNAGKFDNSYAAAYWPWVQVNDPNSGQLVWTVPSSMIPGVYAYNDKTSEAWFAPAGINRGGLNTVVQAQRKLTQTNRDNLYVGKVNPIATFPGKGVVVFGQKTLQTQASALDRINVRRLLIALKSYIVQIADNLVFEQNTAATRNNFLSQVNPYMESVQQRQGLYAFKVVMDSSNNGPDVVDRNQMVGAIYVQPTKTAEFIYLDFNILPTGATFPS